MTTRRKTSFLSTVQREMRVAFFVWKTNVRAALENRVAFALQVGGMMLNDCAFVVVWTLFFGAVGTVNGWGVWQAIGMLGFGTLGFGLAFSFGAGGSRLPRYVDDGSMDGFLLTPRNIFFRVVASKFDLAAFGDVIFGIVLLTIFIIGANISWLGVLMMIGVLPPIALVYLGVNMTVGSISFFVHDAQAIVFSLFKSFLTPSLYPGGLFPSVLKFVFTFFIPSLVVAGLPIDVVTNHDVTLFLLIWILGFVWIGIGYFTFSFGVRHYESGNAIGLRSAN